VGDPDHEVRLQYYDISQFFADLTDPDPKT
jgi:hypothetical protein